MGAILGGAIRSPFTGIVFALELTHDFNLLLPLLVANVIAYGFTILTLKRSILTEKIARRGYRLRAASTRWIRSEILFRTRGDADQHRGVPCIADGE